MPEIDIKINNVYYPHLNNNKRIQIFFGGSSSGKSVFIAQRCVLDILQGDRNYLCVRNTGNTLRSSSFSEIRNVIHELDISSMFTINVSPMEITCKHNNMQAVFTGLDDVEKRKSIRPRKGVFTDIWYEEATEGTRDQVKQLLRRQRGTSSVPKRMTFSLNPINKAHWIFTDFFAGKWDEKNTCYSDDNVSILKTTYKENRFLEADDIKLLEDETDKYYYNVYTLGNWGTLGNVIFTNWRTDDLTEMQDVFDIYKNGMDFGFTNDPTVLVRTARSGDKSKLYILNGFQAYGLTNPEIAVRAKPIIHDERVRCDSAEPKSIRELQDADLNAIPAIKGQGSVNFGIQWIKQHEVIIHQALQGCINDWSLYQYRENKDGRVLNEPIDKDNHWPDATRYSWSGVLFEDKNRGRKARTKDELGIF